MASIEDGRPMSMPRDALGELIEGGDLDELLRHVDRLCAARDWEGLLELRDRCRKALERGRQLWPVASHAEYRLALEAPGPWAAGVLLPGAGRFALGPLPEVAAAGHTWAELAPHLPPSPEATFTAHERVVRGEDLVGDPRVDPAVLEVPLRLEAWEPDYPLAVYRASEAQFPERPVPPLAPVDLPDPPPVADDPDATTALAELADAWTTESDGRARAVAVTGDATGAVAALTRAPAASMAPLDLADALAAMAWTAASGGAHGRRRGMATGRFGAWWALVALTTGLDRWPADAGEVGAAGAALRWYRWETPGATTTGWSLRLAVEDPARGRAWAVEATDFLEPAVDV
jgi:hypothetical protein